MDWFVEVVAWINNHYQTHAGINYTFCFVEIIIALYFRFKNKDDFYAQTLSDSFFASGCFVTMATYFPDIIFSFVFICYTFVLYEGVRIHNKYFNKLEEYKKYTLSKEQIRNALLVIYLPAVFCILCGFIF